MTKNKVILFTPNCLGGRHAVSLSRREGKLSITLHSHGEDSDFPLKSIRSFQALDPEFRCRCVEIIDSWRFYTQAPTGIKYSMPYREFCELYPWGKEAFKLRISGTGEVTASMVLSMLPKEFRGEAKASRDVRDKRQKRRPCFLVDGSGDPNYMPRWAREFFYGEQGGRSSLSVLPTKTILDKYAPYAQVGARKLKPAYAEPHASSRKLNHYLVRLFEKHGGIPFKTPRLYEMERILGANETHTYESKGEGDVCRRDTRLRWIKLYWKYQWMRELVADGYIPVDIPPTLNWEYDESQPLYPRIVSAIQYAPTSSFPYDGDFSKEFDLYSIRVSENWSEGTDPRRFYFSRSPIFGSRFNK